MNEASITIMLKENHGRNEDMVNRLIPVIYDQLKVIAHNFMVRENKDHTLNTTGLVHETYMRMLKQHVEFENRAHFYAIVATTMRRILLESARAKKAIKRGEGASKVPLKEHFLISEEDADQLISIDAALTKLQQMDLRLAQIVEMRYFGGLKSKEIAAVLECSESTVKRGWRMAKAWLYESLNDN